jgi:hypothetical protein
MYKLRYSMSRAGDYGLSSEKSTQKYNSLDALKVFEQGLK